jgi:hypothetical protein
VAPFKIVGTAAERDETGGIGIRAFDLEPRAERDNQVENVHRVEVERLTQICITPEGNLDMAIQPQEIPFEEPAEEPPLELNRFSEPGPPETPPRPAEPQPDLFPPECPPEREPRECLIPALVANRPRQPASPAVFNPKGGHD